VRHWLRTHDWKFMIVAVALFLALMIVIYFQAKPDPKVTPAF